MAVTTSLDELAQQIAERTEAGDLVLAMGAGDVNSLWDRLTALTPNSTGLVA